MYNRRKLLGGRYYRELLLSSMYLQNVFTFHPSLALNIAPYVHKSLIKIIIHLRKLYNYRRQFLVSNNIISCNFIVKAWLEKHLVRFTVNNLSQNKLNFNLK